MNRLIRLDYSSSFKQKNKNIVLIKQIINLKTHIYSKKTKNLKKNIKLSLKKQKLYKTNIE